MIEKDIIASILAKKPFCLDDQSIDWVTQVASSMTLKQKLAQLINVQVTPADTEVLDEIIEYQLGAFSVINFSNAESCRDVINRITTASSIAPLVCADLEGGVTSGNLTTAFPNQLGCAAANTLDVYQCAMEEVAAEAADLGIHWTFSPVIDVSHGHRSAIVGTRSYGSDRAVIGAMAGAYIRAFQNQGVASTLKHWPGEGFDDRDQHLLTTVNPLSVDAWREQFGSLYAQAIDDGVMSVMSAHIALPSYAAAQGVSGIEAYRPASVSAVLNQSLLRDELGFNGVIVSDATLMAGLESWGPRREWLSEVIQNGCDMILFSPSISTDMDVLVQAFETGKLSKNRVDLALCRVLGMKAALGLHAVGVSSDGRGAAPSRSDKVNSDAIDSISALSPTLVKDVARYLPLNKSVVKRILVIKEENVNPLGNDLEFSLRIDEYLAAEGFDVVVFDSQRQNIYDYIDFDLIIYAIAQESMLTKSRIFLDWAKLHGGTLEGMVRTWWDKPTMLISFGHPFYLYDAPRMPCLINAYSPTQAIQRAVVDKLLGRSEFVGASPIDAFCGLYDSHY